MDKEQLIRVQRGESIAQYSHLFPAYLSESFGKAVLERSDPLTGESFYRIVLSDEERQRIKDLESAWKALNTSAPDAGDGQA